MKKLKKLVVLFAAAVLVMLAVPQQALLVSAAETASGNIAEGKYGNINWVIDAGGKLTVTGSGDLESQFTHGGNDAYAWGPYKKQITSAEINVTGMTSASCLFSGCSNLVSVNLKNFDTSKVTNMYYMFAGCSSLKSVNFGTFNTSNVTNMTSMFKGCRSLTSLTLCNLNASKVTTMTSMFADCSGLTSLDLSGLDARNVTDMSEMFRDCSNLTHLDLSSVKTDKLRYMEYMFQRCSSLTSVNVDSFDTSNVLNMTGMFNECSSLKSLNLSSLNTSNVTRMGSMFSGCSSLTSLDVSPLDTSKATDISCMFIDCRSLTSLDLSSFDTRNVTDMSSMFNLCISLTSLDLSSFDTRNVTRMLSFSSCHSLTSLDLSSFDLSKVTYVWATFLDCNNLTTIYTPYNLGMSVELPGTGWRLANGTAITELPKNSSRSVMISRTLTGGGENDGNNNGDSNGNGDGSSNNSGQTGASSGVIPGTGNTTDASVYGSRLITARPTAYNTIMLRWDEVPGAKSYEILYSTSPNSGFKRLNNAKKTFYKFSKAKCGVTYYFQMRVCEKTAKSEFGPVSYASTELVGSAVLQVKKTTYNSVTLKWSKVPGAKKYEIYYTDTVNGSWHLLDVKSGTSYTHKKNVITGATYFYRVRPVRESFFGSYSNSESATTVLGNVTGLKVKADNAGRLNVTWKKVKGATEYVILRSESIDGIYRVVGHSNKTFHVDADVKGGMTYFYKVYAVSGPYRSQMTGPEGQTAKIVQK